MRNLSVLPLVVGLMLVGCDDKPKKQASNNRLHKLHHWQLVVMMLVSKMLLCEKSIPILKKH